MKVLVKVVAALTAAWILLTLGQVIRIAWQIDGIRKAAVRYISTSDSREGQFESMMKTECERSGFSLDPASIDIKSGTKWIRARAEADRRVAIGGVCPVEWRIHISAHAPLF